MIALTHSVAAHCDHGLIDFPLPYTWIRVAEYEHLDSAIAQCSSQRLAIISDVIFFSSASHGGAVGHSKYSKCIYF